MKKGKKAYPVLNNDIYGDTGNLRPLRSICGWHWDRHGINLLRLPLSGQSQPLVTFTSGEHHMGRC